MREFVEHVAKNYNRIQEGAENQAKDGTKYQSYLIQLTDEHNNTLFVELSSNGEYWSINSAGVFNQKYGDNKKNIWSASSVQNVGPATNSGGLRENGEAGSTSTPKETPHQTSSTDKDTNKTRVEAPTKKEEQKDNATNTATTAIENVKAEVKQKQEAAKNAPKKGSPAQQILDLQEQLKVAKEKAKWSAGAKAAVEKIEHHIDELRRVVKKDYNNGKISLGDFIQFIQVSALYSDLAVNAEINEFYDAAPDPFAQGKAKHKFGMDSYVAGKEDGRTELRGVSYKDGYVTACDGRIIVQKKEDYPVEREGKIFSDKGYEIDSEKGYPKVDSVFPTSTDNMIVSEFDAADMERWCSAVIAQAAKARTNLSGREKSGARAEVIIKIGSAYSTYDADLLYKFAQAAVEIGATKLYFENKVSPFLLYAESDKGRVKLMPVKFESREIPSLGIYAYRATTREIADMNLEELDHYSKALEPRIEAAKANLKEWREKQKNDYWLKRSVASGKIPNTPWITYNGLKEERADIEKRREELGADGQTENEDAQGNPLNADGSLKVETVSSVDEITDEDFTVPMRNVQLPELSENVAAAIGTDGKPVVIKKNVFEKNRDEHKELSPEKSRDILQRALYNPNLVGTTRKAKRPDYRVVIQTGDKNAVVVLDVYDGKDNTEIVGWREIDAKGLEKMKKQAEREDGQLLILSPKDGSAAALSALPSTSASKDKGNKREKIRIGERDEKAEELLKLYREAADARSKTDIFDPEYEELLHKRSEAWNAYCKYIDSPYRSSDNEHVWYGQRENEHRKIYYDEEEIGTLDDDRVYSDNGKKRFFVGDEAEQELVDFYLRNDAAKSVDEITDEGYTVGTEKDSRGNPFVLSSEENIDFGQIRPETGLTPAPIRLSEGQITNTETNSGYGLKHIEARHGDEIRKAGFSSVREFVEHVAEKFTTIKRGEQRDGNDTYLLEIYEGHNNTLFVELSSDDSYWNVNSAGILRDGYSKNKETIWTLPTIGNSTNADAVEVNNGQTKGATAVSENSSQKVSSTDKDTNKTHAETPTKKEEQKDNTTNTATTAVENVKAEVKQKQEAQTHKEGYIFAQKYLALSERLKAAKEKAKVYPAWAQEANEIEAKLRELNKFVRDKLSLSELLRYIQMSAQGDEFALDAEINELYDAAPHPFVQGKAKHKFDVSSYTADKKETHKALQGVLYKDGNVTASDRHIIVQKKEDYPAEKEGKIFNDKGYEIDSEEGYPKVDGIFPTSTDNLPMSYFDAADMERWCSAVVEQSAKARALLKGGKRKTAIAYVLIKIGSVYEAYNADLLYKFAQAAVEIGATKLYLENATGCPLYAESDKGRVKLMPIFFESRETSPLGVYAYRATTKEIADMSSEELDHYSKALEPRIEAAEVTLKEWREKQKNDYWLKWEAASVKTTYNELKGERADIEKRRKELSADNQTEQEDAQGNPLNADGSLKVEKERQAVKEEGLILALPNKQDNAAGDTSDHLSSADKDTKFRKGQGETTTAIANTATVHSAASDLQQQFGVEVEVIDNPDSIPNATARKAIAAGQNVKGWYDIKTGKVYLYAPNIESEQDAATTYIHEVVAHSGMRQLLGEDKYNELCEKLYNQLTDEQKERISQYSDQSAEEQGDEYFAAIAEAMIDERGNIKEPSLFRKVVAAIREFFRDVLGISMSDNDIRYMLWKSANNLKRNSNKATQLNDAITEMRFSMESENTAEEEQIIRDAKFNGTYLKAPNGKDTNLTPKQWVRVRTKAFKRWFGDWEKLYRIEKLRKSKSIRISSNEIKRDSDARQYANNALDYGKNLRGTYINKDTGKRIEISKKGLQEILHHDINDDAHIQSVAAIPDIIENAIYIDSAENEDKIKNPNVAKYHYYVCGLKIGKEDYTVKMVVAEHTDGQRYYDHGLTQIEKGQLLDQLFAITSHGFNQEAPLSEGKDKRLISVLQTDSSNCVDKNGEPQVVHHGTRHFGFSIFDPEMTDFGIFFSTNARTSAAYTGKDRATFPKITNGLPRYDGGIYKCFINAKNTLRVTPSNKSAWNGIQTHSIQLSQQDLDFINRERKLTPEDRFNNTDEYFLSEFKDDYKHWAETSTDNIARLAKILGYDSVHISRVRDGNRTVADDWIMLNGGSAIKSATENNGDYSSNNNDIRFAIGKKKNFSAKDKRSALQDFIEKQRERQEQNQTPFSAMNKATLQNILTRNMDEKQRAEFLADERKKKAIDFIHLFGHNVEAEVKDLAKMDLKNRLAIAKEMGAFIKNMLAGMRDDDIRRKDLEDLAGSIFISANPTAKNLITWARKIYDHAMDMHRRRLRKEIYRTLKTKAYKKSYYASELLNVLKNAGVNGGHAAEVFKNVGSNTLGSQQLAELYYEDGDTRSGSLVTAEEYYETLLSEVTQAIQDGRDGEKITVTDADGNEYTMLAREAQIQRIEAALTAIRLAQLLCLARYHEEKAKESNSISAQIKDKELKSGYIDEASKHTEESISFYSQFVQAINAALAENKDAYKELLKDKTMRKIAICRAVLKDIGGLRPNSDSTLKQRKSGSALRALLSPSITLDTVCRIIGRNAIRGEGRTWSLLHSTWLAARENELRRKREIGQMIDEEIKSIFGNDSNVNKLLREQSDLTLDKEYSYYFGNEKITTKLSVGQALCLRAWARQKNGMKKIAATFFGSLNGLTAEDKAELIEEAEQLMEEINDELESKFNKHVQFADWVVDTLLPTLRVDYADRYFRKYNHEMAYVENYFPFKSSREGLYNSNLTVEEESFDRPKTHIELGEDIERINSANGFALADASFIATLNQHLAHEERALNYFEFEEVANAILGSKLIENKLNAIRPDLAERMREQISVVLFGAATAKVRNSVDDFASKILQNIARSKIGFRVWTALKQFASVSMYITEDPRVFAKAINPLSIPAAWKWANSEDGLRVLQERFDSRASGNEVLQLDSRYKGQLSSFIGKAAKISMTPNAFVDVLVCANGAYAQYQVRLKHYTSAGFDEATAKTLARQDAEVIFNKSQQSQESFYMSKWQTTGGTMATLTNMFMNSNYSWGRIAQQWWRDAKRFFGKNSELFKKEYKQTIADIYMANGLDEQQALDASEEEYKRKIWTVLCVPVGLAISTVVWNLLSETIPTAIAAASDGDGGDGDDDDEGNVAIFFSQGEADRLKNSAQRAMVTSALSMAMYNVAGQNLILPVLEYLVNAQLGLEDVSNGDLMDNVIDEQINEYATIMGEGFKNKDMVEIIANSLFFASTVSTGVDPRSLTEFVASMVYLAQLGDGPMSDVKYALSMAINAPQSMQREYLLSYINKPGGDNIITQLAMLQAHVQRRRISATHTPSQYDVDLFATHAVQNILGNRMDSNGYPEAVEHIDSGDKLTDVVHAEKYGQQKSVYRSVANKLIRTDDLIERLNSDDKLQDRMLGHKSKNLKEYILDVAKLKGKLVWRIPKYRELFEPSVQTYEEWTKDMNEIYNNIDDDR